MLLKDFSRAKLKDTSPSQEGIEPWSPAWQAGILATIMTDAPVDVVEKENYKTTIEETTKNPPKMILLKSTKRCVIVD